VAFAGGLGGTVRWPLGPADGSRPAPA